MRFSTFCGSFLLMVCGGQILAEPLPADLPGHWFNTENNDTVGLILNADKTCELYTSRLTAPKSQKACKYEFYKDKTYFIYLKAPDGQCSTEADFEFRYYADAHRVDLVVGDGNTFLMEKKRLNEAPPSATQALPAALISGKATNTAKP